MLTKSIPSSSSERRRSSTVTPDPGATQFSYVGSILEFQREDWEACFAHEIEGYDYHVAIEKAGIPGFSFGWYAAWHNGQLLCAIPHFVTTYDLATTAQGKVQAMLTKVQRYVPGKLRLNLSCLGSPETERCQIGFRQDLDADAQSVILPDIIGFWLAHSKERGINLIGVKDMNGSVLTNFRNVFDVLGFRAVTSLPSAHLLIDFPTMEAYFAQLSYATRKDMRRKLKARASVEVSITRDVANVMPEIVDMYHETRARSDWAFEELTAEYFSNVLEYSDERAFFVLYRSQGKLVAANLLLQSKKELLDKFFVMRAAEGRSLNLYFLSWFENIQRCIDHGIKTYVAGQAAYDSKIKLGCRIEPNWILFRHRNRILNLLLRLASPFLAVEQPYVPAKICERPQ